MSIFLIIVSFYFPWDDKDRSGILENRAWLVGTTFVVCLCVERGGQGIRVL